MKTARPGLTGYLRAKSEDVDHDAIIVTLDDGKEWRCWKAYYYFDSLEIGTLGGTEVVRARLKRDDDFGEQSGPLSRCPLATSLFSPSTFIPLTRVRSTRNVDE